MKKQQAFAKEKALIALASVVALQCDYCVEFHKEVAISSGATKEEMLEAAAIGGLVRLGSGFASASMILEDRQHSARYERPTIVPIKKCLHNKAKRYCATRILLSECIDQSN